ncbi:MAG: protein-L-isoaspartate(D-aspartate) O-methyltransferase [Deltaproteobacteria bacterium]|nr:protein-L-isoaspartate(D-aspartate) O-methyltransferase [Deltaproteobacteria bacterium]
MVEEQLIPAGVRDPKVLKVMGMVPRHRFVDKALEDQAYLDRSMTITSGQTISQPAIVGIMTQSLELKGTEKILEIGTGSGYQTAVLASLAKKVYTVERLSTLSLRARKIIYRLSCNNIEFKIGDGTLGWPEHAPYDAIIVTAVGPEVPLALKSQLTEGGRLVIPVGSVESQKLYLLKREGDKWSTRILSDCRFVKLIGKEGWGGE